MDILITKNGFQTLMDVIITNPIYIDMVQQTLTTTIHVVMMVAQENTRSYVERALGNDFIPLSIETYGCLHSHHDSFFTTCA
jgi:hypothetical protein